MTKKRQVTAPRSAAHPRPYNRPFYIKARCPDCGTPLVLEDLLAPPDTPEDAIWYDEWACPRCWNPDDPAGYLDWPNWYTRQMFQRKHKSSRQDDSNR